MLKWMVVSSQDWLLGPKERTGCVLKNELHQPETPTRSNSARRRPLLPLHVFFPVAWLKLRVALAQVELGGHWSQSGQVPRPRQTQPMRW